MGKSRTRKIRLAMLRCDTHGYYFGTLFAPCDPLVLEKYNKIVHYYATDWYNPARITLPTTYDFEITRCWDYDFARAERFSQAFLGTAKPCRTVDEATEGIDAVFVSDCNGGGGDHLKLAAPFLKKGIPTFVDKPFASTLKDAREMIRLARKHKTPLYNSSILSEVIAADTFRRRFDEIEPAGADWRTLSQAAVALKCRPEEVPGVMLGVVKGVGGAMSQETAGQGDIFKSLDTCLAYLIHGIALAINVFGKGVEWVEAMGSAPLECLRLGLKNGRSVMILNPSVAVFPERCSFYVEAYSKCGAIHSGPIGDPEFLHGADRIVKKFRNMVRTGKPPRDYDDIVEQIAVVEAGQRAQQTGKRVYMEDVLRGGKA